MWPHGHEPPDGHCCLIRCEHAHDPRIAPPLRTGATGPPAELRERPRWVRRFLAWRNPARQISGTWMAGRLRANHLGRYMSVTEPRSMPSRSATEVSGQRQPFPAKIRLSAATTPAAMPTRRSDRLAKPAYRTYIMHASMENQTAVWMTMIARRAASEPSAGGLASMTAVRRSLIVQLAIAFTGVHIFMLKNQVESRAGPRTSQSRWPRAPPECGCGKPHPTGALVLRRHRRPRKVYFPNGQWYQPSVSSTGSGGRRQCESPR